MIYLITAISLVYGMIVVWFFYHILQLKKFN